MKKVILAAISAALALAIAASGAPPAKKSETTTQVARGKYLVENVGMCADCHSPRNEKGEYIKEKWLQGAPIMFKVDIPMPFANAAPGIAGLPGLDEDIAVEFLTGNRDKLPARPPMPEYKFSREDAIAVVKYLKTLKPGDAKPIEAEARK